jgi:hypothetical protein
LLERNDWLPCTSSTRAHALNEICGPGLPAAVEADVIRTEVRLYSEKRNLASKRGISRSIVWRVVPEWKQSSILQLADASPMD